MRPNVDGVPSVVCHTLMHSSHFTYAQLPHHLMLLSCFSSGHYATRHYDSHSLHTGGARILRHYDSHSLHTGGARILRAANNYSNGRTSPSSDLSRTFCNQTRTAEECGIRVNGRAFCNTLKISVACCMYPECLSGCQRRRQRLISLSSRVVSNSNTACTLASPSDIVASVGGLAIEQSSIPFCLKAKRQRKTNYFCLTILFASLSHSLSFFILYARGP